MKTDFLFSLLLIATLHGISGNPVAEDDGSTMRFDTTKIAITAFTEDLGYSWQWEREFGRLTCTRQSDKLRFYEGKCFYYGNGSVEKLPVCCSPPSPWW